MHPFSSLPRMRRALGPRGEHPEVEAARWQGRCAGRFESRACAGAPRGRGLGGGGLAGQVGVCGCGRRLGAVSDGGCNSAPALLMAARWPLRSEVVVRKPARLGRTVRPRSLGTVPSSPSPGSCSLCPLGRSAKARGTPRGRL